MLGVCLQRTSRWPEAEELYREFAHRHPDDANAPRHLGTALRKQGRPAEAAAVYRRALERAAGRPEADWQVALLLPLLGEALGEHGDWDGAVAAFQRAADLGEIPDHARNYGADPHCDHLAALARAHVRRGSVRDAAPLYLQAFRAQLADLSIARGQARSTEEKLKAAAETDRAAAQSYRQAAIDYLGRRTDEATLLAVQAAPILLEAKDVEGYRTLCRLTVEAFGDTDNPTTAERTARVCSLAPDSSADVKRVLGLAELAVTRGKASPAYGLFRLTRGMAAYRAGDWASTREWCQRGRARQPGPASVEVLTRQFEAMAAHRLSKTAEARELLARATELLDQHLGKKQEGLARDWDLLMGRVVGREAESLLTRAAGPMETGPPPRPVKP